MLAWITENIGTILISAVLLLVVVLIIRKLVKDKKKGKSSCGCNCAHCAMSGSCHQKYQSNRRGDADGSICVSPLP